MLRNEPCSSKGGRGQDSGEEAQQSARDLGTLLGIFSDVYIRTLTRLSLGILQDQRKRTPVESERFCLTPSHVYRALLKGAFRGGVNEAIFNASASIGTSDRMVRATSVVVGV